MMKKKHVEFKIFSKKKENCYDSDLTLLETEALLWPDSFPSAHAVRPQGELTQDLQFRLRIPP